MSKQYKKDKLILVIVITNIFQYFFVKKRNFNSWLWHRILLYPKKGTND